MRSSRLGTADAWGTTHTVYTPELQLLSTKAYFTSFRLPETTTAQRDIVWFGGTPVAQVDGLTAPRTIRYTFTDHLGTPLLQTNPAGQVVWQAEYDPYGTIVQQRTGTSDNQPLRFPGQEAELDTNLYQNVFRWYRPNWGRYTQVDPLERRGDPHPYLYVLGNPLRFTDPDGRRSRVCCTPVTDIVPASYFSHCFIQTIDSAGASKTYSLHNMGDGWGCTFKNDSFDTKAAANMFTPCGPWKEDCGTDGCVAAAHEVYPNSSSYSWTGTNSNTYASTIASDCGLKPPQVPLENYGAPGWGNAPAAPFAGKNCPKTR